MALYPEVRRFIMFGGIVEKAPFMVELKGIFCVEMHDRFLPLSSAFHTLTPSLNFTF